MEPWVSRWITPDLVSKEESRALATWFETRGIEHVRMFRVIEDGFSIEARRMLKGSDGKFYIRKGSRPPEVMTQAVELLRDDCPVPERFL